MKTTEHGIEDSKDIENMHHMRLMTLLQELVRDKGFKGAARVLELDQRTVAECAKDGAAVEAGGGRRWSVRCRRASGRRRPGSGNATTGWSRGSRRWRRAMRRMRRAMTSWARSCGGEWRPSRARLRPCGVTLPRGPGPVRPAPVPPGRRPVASDAGSRPTSKPRVRREYPDLVTLEPAEDDEEGVRRCVAAHRRVAGAEGRSPQRGEGPCVAGGGGAPAGGGAGPARRPRHERFRRRSGRCGGSTATGKSTGEGPRSSTRGERSESGSF